MKKNILSSVIAITVLGSVTAKADIAITNVHFVASGENFNATGSLKDDGTGVMASIDPFLGMPWTATQETTFMDNTSSWSGVSVAGAYDYNAAIADMSADQVAVGIFFNWNNNNEAAILEIFDCAGGICTGNGVPMVNGVFPGQTFVFSGTGDASVVPVPAAAWLMVSGLFGLVGFTRRRIQV